VPGDSNLWPNLTGGEIIDFLGELRGGLDPARREDLIRRFDLDPRKKARAYSKGNRQKVALVTALASDAELLVLDEPTSGLDPLMEAIFQDCILTAKYEGRTVLLSSHILAEVERSAIESPSSAGAAPCRQERSRSYATSRARPSRPRRCSPPTGLPSYPACTTCSRTGTGSASMSIPTTWTAWSAT
jgi:hypothetical protein